MESLGRASQRLLHRLHDATASCEGSSVSPDILDKKISSTQSRLDAAEAARQAAQTRLSAECATQVRAGLKKMLADDAASPSLGGMGIKLGKFLIEEAVLPIGSLGQIAYHGFVKGILSEKLSQLQAQKAPRPLSHEESPHDA